MIGSKKTYITLFIGLAGALVAYYFGLPAPSLIGATIAVSCGSIARITGDIPVSLKNIAFAIIGTSLGSSITTDALADVSKWPISLSILGIAVIAIIYFSSIILIKVFHIGADTAFLATSPGALAYVMALAAEGKGDIRSVAVIQSFRVVAVITTIPFILTHLGLHPEQPVGVISSSMSIAAFIIVFSSAFLIGLLFSRLKIPAAFFLAGIFVSGFAHLSGLVIGRPADGIIFVGFTITGSLVGARFSTFELSEIRALFWGSVSALLVSVFIAALFAGAVSTLLVLPFGQVFVAFAPGGVEAMAAMALSLHYDPAYVAVHHLFRIFFLILILPLFLRTTKHLREK